MIDTILKEGLIECQHCKESFDISDAEEFEQFCSATCEGEHNQEWAEFKEDELQDEALMEELSDQELSEFNGEGYDYRLQNWRD